MLWSRTMNAESMHPGPILGGRRERFEAVRQRVFSDMKGMSSRWRLAMMLPFHALVIGILAVRGFPTGRLAIQIACTLAIMIGFSAMDRSHGVQSRKYFFFCGIAILAAIANTGGLASPLVLSLIPYVTGIAMNPELDHRRLFVAKFIVLFGLMAAFARVCSLPAPLSSAAPFATREYVAIAFLSAVSALVMVYHIGKKMTGAYERIAMELAERREELCDENEGRTRALEGIAARLAHEVKNPLAAIKGLSQHMARGLHPEDNQPISNCNAAKMKERLEIVASEAERLQGIVDGFLSFSRGLDELTVGPTKPYEISRELSLLLETRAADAGVGIEVRGSREVTLAADSKKLRQALLNLVLNAMQASTKGSTVTLEVAKSCSDGSAVLRVIDRGAGMTAEVIDRIRKPYFTTKEGGSGLGIAVARGIIEQHGGTLRFESTAGRGTTAIVILPSSPDQRRQALPNPCRMAMSEAAAKWKERISSATTPAATETSPDVSLPALTPSFAHATTEKVPS